MSNSFTDTKLFHTEGRIVDFIILHGGFYAMRERWTPLYGVEGMRCFVAVYVDLCLAAFPLLVFLIAAIALHNTVFLIVFYLSFIPAVFLVFIAIKRQIMLHNYRRLGKDKYLE